MLKLQEIYKICVGFEKQGRKSAIKKLMNQGYNEIDAANYYNIWRRHFMESSSKDLLLSGIYIQSGKYRKPLEACSYSERQSYLEALSKKQLIKITQAVLK